jgi:hypothetical protein
MIFHVAPSVASLNDRPQDIYYIRWRKWQAHHQEIGGPVGILERATSVCVFVYDSSLRVCIIPCQKLISGTSSSSSSHTHSGTPVRPSIRPSIDWKQEKVMTIPSLALFHQDASVDPTIAGPVTLYITTSLLSLPSLPMRQIKTGRMWVCLSI